MRIAPYEAACTRQPAQAGAAAMTAVATSGIIDSVRSADALWQLCRGIITGEGPTASGRVHFSRTMDAEDAELCARILVAAGQSGEPVSCKEVDALFDIHAAASEQRDGGRFDALFAKAVLHHVMSASGVEVPRRELALDPAMPLDAWAAFTGLAIREELASWLEQRLRDLTRQSPAVSLIARIVSGKETAAALAMAAVFDRAA